MNYNIKGTALEISPEVRTYVEGKLAHLDKFFKNDTAAHADIELEYFPGEQSKKHRAEFAVVASGKSFRAEERAVTLHEAVDLALAELSKEVDRSNKKSTKLFRRGAARFKDFVRGFRNQP